MDLNEYKQLALRTESNPESITINPAELNYALGIFITVADMLDAYKKMAFYGKREKYDKIWHESCQKLQYMTSCSDRHHEIIDDQPLTMNKRIFHGLLGACTEAGELAEHLQKGINGHETDPAGIVEELADIFWYASVISDETNVPLEQGLINNINKLSKRYPEGYSDYLATHRNLETERQELENNIVNKS